MMADYFLIVFGLVCLMCPCEGLINLPPGGKSLVFVKGKTATIKWSFNKTVDLTKIHRFWYFMTGGSKLIVEVLAGSKPTIKDDVLPGVIKIGDPASLILENVDLNYNGKYRFQVGGEFSDRSDIMITIAEKPKVIVNCTGINTVNEGDYFACQCKGEGGNPTPANVTWYDNEGMPIDGTGKGEKLLIRRNVKKTDSGSYRCEAKTHEMTKDEKLIKLIVKFPPENVRVMLQSEMAERGKPFVIKCEAEAEPPAKFKIFLNKTEVPISGDTYTIPKVNDSHVGSYKCVAKNDLGSSNSLSRYLRVGNAETHGGDDGGLATGAIVGIVIGVLVFVLIIVLVYLFVFKKKNNDHERVRSESGRATEQPVSKSNQPPEYATLEPPEQLTYAALDQKALKQGAAGKPASTNTPTEYAAIQVS